MKAFLKEMFYCHKFFMTKSYDYSQTAFIKHPFQWLRAYFIFMKLSFSDEYRKLIHSASN